jgi:hypothetical protein
MARDEEELLIEKVSREELRGLLWEKKWKDVDWESLEKYMDAITDISNAGIIFGRSIEWGEPVEDVEVSPDLVSTFSIKFNQGELPHIEAAALRDGKTIHQWCRDVLLSVAQLTTRSPE